jgi:hypothetical protein
MQVIIILPEWKILSKPIFTTNVQIGPHGHVAHLFKLSNCWSKFKLFGFNEMFKSLREGKQNVPWVNIHIFYSWVWIYFRYKQANRAFLVAVGRKGTSCTNCGGVFVNYFYSDNLIYYVNWVWSRELRVSNVYTKRRYNLSVKYANFISIYIAIILCSTKIWNTLLT